MAIATLSVDLVAQLARFEADLGKAARMADLAAGRIGSSFGGIRDVFIGSALAEGAAELARQLVALAPALIDNVAHFQDLEETTGASAVALASFATAGDVAGVSADQLAGFMVKLTGTLSKTDDESKGAGAALKALGLGLEEFKRLRPEDQFTTLAQRLEGFQDGAGKTAVAVALLGKSGAEALPFFKELASTSERQIRLTADQIKQADDYADRLARMRSELRQAAQIAALQALPAFATLGEKMIEAATGATTLASAANGLQGNTAIKDFAESSAKALADLADSVADTFTEIQLKNAATAKEFANLKLLFDGVGIVRKSAGAGIFSTDTKATQAQLSAALAERNRTVEDADKRIEELLNRGKSKIGAAVRGSLDEQARLQQPENARENQRFAESAKSITGARPVLNVAGLSGGEDSAAAKAAREAAASRQALLKEAIAQIEAGFASERDAFAFQDRFLEGEYSAGLISLRAFHDERAAIEQKALDAQVASNAAKVADLKKYQQTIATGSPEEIRTAGEIQSIEAETARARDQFARDQALRLQQQTAGYKQLRDQVVEFAAQVKQLQGDDFGAAKLRADQAVENARALSQRAGVSFDEGGYRSLIENVNRLAEAQKHLGLATSQAAAEEELFRIRAESRGAGLAETEAGVFEIRQRSLEQLRSLSAQADALANGAAPNSPAVQFARQLHVELERAAATVDPALDRIRRFSGDVAGALAGFTEESILNVNDLTGALDELGESLKRIAVNALVTEPLEASLRGLISSAATANLGGAFGAPSAQAVVGATGDFARADRLAGTAADVAGKGLDTAASAAALSALTGAATTAEIGLAALGVATGAAESALLPLQLTLPALDTGFAAVVVAANAAATALAQVAASAAAKSVVGFSDGGYTGGAGERDPVGVVHGKEYVFSAPAVRRLGVGALDRLHTQARAGAPRLSLPGYANGGYVGTRLVPVDSGLASAQQRPEVKIAVTNNMAGQAEVSTRQRSDGSIDILVDAVRSKLGREIDSGQGLAKNIGRRFGANSAATLNR